VTKEENAVIDESSVENKIKWKIIFPERKGSLQGGT
jgi:hypothetical protein